MEGGHVTQYVPFEDQIAVAEAVSAAQEVSAEEYSNSLETMLSRIRAVDWSPVCRIIQTYGGTLNSPDMRAIKGKIYEDFVSKAMPSLDHVDREGYDIQCRDTNMKIEVKSAHHLLLTKVQRQLKTNITFRLKNSNGSGQINLNEDNTADIYILIQQDAVAFTTREYVLANMSSPNGGDIDAKIPQEYIELLYKADEALQVPEQPNINLSINLPEIINLIISCVNVAIWNGGDIRSQVRNCLHEIADNL